MSDIPIGEVEKTTSRVSPLDNSVDALVDDTVALVDSSSVSSGGNSTSIYAPRTKTQLFVPRPTIKITR